LTEDINNHNGCGVTIDGTDFRIYEPTDFNTTWFSHKFNGPGIRYEVAISIKGGQIMHIQGPYPAGKWPDIKIFRDCLKYKLLEGRKLRSITAITGSLTRSARHPRIILAGRKNKRIARACREMCNRRFKHWGVLSQRIRHGLVNHRTFFGAIVVITQLELRTGHPLFAFMYD
jgi:hypothetical protein